MCRKYVWQDVEGDCPTASPRAVRNHSVFCVGFPLETLFWKWVTQLESFHLNEITKGKIGLSKDTCMVFPYTKNVFFSYKEIKSSESLTWS